jgi:benzil reductase ((S)-benzoin forming)
MNHIYITGTGKGIGKALAEVLLEEGGNTVYGISRQQSIHLTNYHHYTLDLSQPELVKNFRFEAIEKTDKVVLVNNAGMLGDVSHLGTLGAQSIIDTYMVNAIAPTILTNSFISAYKDIATEKIIINLSSGAAQTAYDGWTLYCSTKAALEMMTRVGHEEQQLDALEYPFRFLSIAPHVVDTDMQKQARNFKAENFSRVKKFLDLKANDELYNVYDVAREFARIIKNPDSIKGVTHRISL